MTGLAPVPVHPRRLVYLGTPELAVPPLRALVAAGFEVALVVTRADARRGRGSATSPSPVKAAALELGLAVSDRVEDVLDVDADLGVVVAFGRLIRRPVLERLPMVNLHFSLLPRWRGAAPVERALLAGDERTGVCVMQLEEGLDTGPVFAVAEVPIAPRASASDLRRELVEVGTDLLVSTLESGLGVAVAQAGDVTYADKLGTEDLRLDWSTSVVHLDRQVRVGGAHTTVRGARLKVLAAEPEANGPPPGVLDGTLVGAADGGLRLVTVQPEGKAAMAAEAWVRGARLSPDERLGS